MPLKFAHMSYLLEAFYSVRNICMYNNIDSSILLCSLLLYTELSCPSVTMYLKDLTGASHDHYTHLTWGDHCGVTGRINEHGIWHLYRHTMVGFIYILDNRDMLLFKNSSLCGCYKPRHVTNRDVLLLVTLR